MIGKKGMGTYEVKVKVFVPTIETVVITLPVQISPPHPWDPKGSQNILYSPTVMDSRVKKRMGSCTDRIIYIESIKELSIKEA